MTNVILSIKPIYAHAIILGIKKVEFRKKIFKKPVEKVFIYSSFPEKKIIGYFTIKEIIEDKPKELWSRFNKIGGISKENFFKYYRDSKIGYTIKIDKIKKIDINIDPKDFIKKFHAPQSYKYLEKNSDINLLLSMNNIN